MIELAFGAADLGRVRFALCPVREAVFSLRTLAIAAPNGLHAPWVRAVRPLLGGLDMALLAALVRPTGYLPDFLLPAPPYRADRFETGIAQVAAVDPAVVGWELNHLADHRVAQRGPGRDARTALLRDLAAEPADGLARVVAELTRYWRVAVRPHWPRIRALLRADLSYRLEELAAGGVRQLFRTLHPLVSFHDERLRIVKYYTGRADLGGRGLLLVPCAFAWPDAVVRTADPQPALTYPPRGLGRLWDGTPAIAGPPLAGVLGRARAGILAQLDVPMSTTQLAHLLALTPPTLSVHLRALAAAGIVARRRDGRAVLYHRTALGDRLLAGAADADG